MTCGDVATVAPRFGSGPGRRVVDVVLEDGQPGKFRLAHDVQRVGQRRAPVDGHDLDPRRHDVRDLGLAEVEDALDLRSAH